VALSRKGKLYVTGSNKWGQLGFAQEITELYAFTAIELQWGRVFAVTCDDHGTAVATNQGLFVTGINVGAHTEYHWNSNKNLAGFRMVTNTMGHESLFIKKVTRPREEEIVVVVDADVVDKTQSSSEEPPQKRLKLDAQATVV
jgi:hypothetical protein